MAKNQLRDKLAALQLALDYAVQGGDPRTFLRLPISDRDAGAWVRSGQLPHDPELQDEVSTLLRALVARGEHETEIRLRFELKRHDKGVLVSRGAVIGNRRPYRDLLLYRLIRLLEDVGVERLMECAAPDCDDGTGRRRLFLKVTRKEYCSTRCQARVNMRNQRKRNDEERRKREAAELARKELRRGKTTRTR